uniref:NAR1.6 n=1 Tax=Chlamydomonas reinhardtii TaxID=3055 RepID=Q6IYG2_CHLRE|nr:NAR1.6 [Chlamydomonas reinhardtii]
MSTSIVVDPARGHAEERAQIGGLTAATASKGDAALFRLFITPLEVWNKVVATGVAKAKYSWPKKVLLSFLAGAYLSFGMAFAFLVGGQLKNIKVDDPGLYNVILGFFGLPFGLTMIILMGSDLYTSDVTFMLAAWCEGKTKMTAVVWNLVYCWFGNLCGSLFMVQMYIWGDVFSGREAFEETVAVKKTSPDFGVNFVRGMLCNWLVNIATWQAMTAQDVTGKFVGVLIPVTIFVASGFEHCIANQFGIPMGMRLGGAAQYVTTSEAIVKNYIPVTLGNSVAAMIFIVGFYFFSIGSGHDMVVNSWNSGVTRYLPPMLAGWLQTGDVVAAEGGLQPLPGKFIGDISVHYGGVAGGGGGTPSHRGISAALRALTSSMRGTHAPPPAAVVSAQPQAATGEGANGKSMV